MISPETIVRAPEGEIAILVASEGLTVIRGRCAPGVQIAGRHRHLEHTDAFYVLEGELTFELGPEAEAVTVGAGGFLAVPPGVTPSATRATDGRPASRSTLATAASPRSCAAAATASTWTGTSPTSRPAAGFLRTKRWSGAGDRAEDRLDGRVDVVLVRAPVARPRSGSPAAAASACRSSTPPRLLHLRTSARVGRRRRRPRSGTAPGSARRRSGSRRPGSAERAPGERAARGRSSARRGRRCRCGRASGSRRRPRSRARGARTRASSRPGRARRVAPCSIR